MDLNSGSDFRASKTNTEVLITGLVKTPGLTTRY
jgi:hypothetical protein